MKIAIVGAGFCGLTAAFRLSQKGHKITVFEKEKFVGGLASDFDIFDDHIKIERFVHHFFQSDKHVISLIKELGLEDKLFFTKSRDANFYNGKIYPFASAVDLLKFSPLPFFDRIRLGLTTLYLKLNNDWKKFENVTASSWVQKWMGKKVFEVLWEPLLAAKFGSEFDKVSMVWFWARIKSRTAKLGYLKGGFEVLAQELEKKIIEGGGEIKFDSPVLSIKSKNNKIEITTKDKNHLFDKVIVTVPASVIASIVKDFPKSYLEKLKYPKFLAATSLVLVSNKSLIPNYWLNILDNNSPFLVAVEHTNFADIHSYNDKTIMYFGNYLPSNSEDFKLSKEDALKKYWPYILKINPKFDQKNIEQTYFNKALYAQPIVDINYSSKIPEIKTPIANVYVATMAQIYPWDRGTNYAVELGQKVAKMAT